MRKTLKNDIHHIKCENDNYLFGSDVAQDFARFGKFWLTHNAQQSRFVTNVVFAFCNVLVHERRIASAQYNHIEIAVW